MGMRDSSVTFSVIVEEQPTRASKVLGYGIEAKKVKVSYPSLSGVKQLIDEIVEQLRQTDVAEAEVTFGVQFDTEGNLAIPQGTEQANLVFKLKFTR